MYLLSLVLFKRYISRVGLKEIADLEKNGKVIAILKKRSGCEVKEAKRQERT